MKNAPNLKHLPKDKFNEAVIFAGVDAFAHAQHWIESEGKKAGDPIPPIWLGPKQLAELDNLRIIDKGRRFARVYLAGDIEQIMINAIAEKLALAGVEDAKLYKGMPDNKPAPWRNYLARIREQAERGESLVDEVRQAQGKPASLDELAPCVESRADGLYWVTPKIDKVSGEIIRPGQLLCDPLVVEGIGMDDAERFLILSWTPAGSREKHIEAVPMRSIGDREGWARLRAGGLFTAANPRLRNVLADHLLRSGRSELWHITSLTGWQHGAYIMPDGKSLGSQQRK